MSPPARWPPSCRTFHAAEREPSAPMRAAAALRLIDCVSRRPTTARQTNPGHVVAIVKVVAGSSYATMAPRRSDAPRESRFRAHS
jgi:hypothetical protein